jgi:uncharacterized protein
VTLTDTGPLIALIDKNDPNHARVLAGAQALPPGPLLTTLLCFTETMYFLAKAGGHSAQQRLWGMRQMGKLLLHPVSEEELDRMETLMAKYKDLPMDVADASLVVTAETLNIARIFTLDSHFRAFRIHNTGTFQIIP